MNRPGVAVVTGASAGIGREFCEQLAARGHDLLLVARDAARLAELADDLGRRFGIAAESFPADLSCDEAVTRLIRRIEETPGLALLVNNAGFGTRGLLADAPPAEQEAMVRLHALAPMRLTQAALPILLRNGSGAVVNVSSVASFIYSAGNVNYCATKAYLTTFTEGLAAELMGTGVQAQALCPGFTRSEFHRRMQVSTDRPPAFLWMDAQTVVRASLRSLDHRGRVVCVPGLRYRILVGMIRLCPRPLLGWVTSLKRGRNVT
jgi:short-subunit dehydrogenase